MKLSLALAFSFALGALAAPIASEERSANEPAAYEIMTLKGILHGTNIMKAAASLADGSSKWILMDSIYYK